MSRRAEGWVRTLDLSICRRPAPHDLEISYVALVDLAQRRVLRTAEITTILRPLPTTWGTLLSVKGWLG